MDNNEFLYLPEPTGGEAVGRNPGSVVEPAGGMRQRPAPAGGAGNGGGQNEMAGLVLLINTVLGGLGTLYVTTKSAGITLISALLVLLIIVVVLVVKRVVAAGDRPGEKDDRGGK
ncbi:hypothetical protein [Streptomyces sp. NPDC002187]|uniref:hypothetical protein n=1 Tax=Streptomyces sp. NPDC002187 TaxID=3364637 RepID=UPI0036858BD0